MYGSFNDPLFQTASFPVRVLWYVLCSIRWVLDHSFVIMWWVSLVVGPFLIVGTIMTMISRSRLQQTLNRRFGGRVLVEDIVDEPPRRFGTVICIGIFLVWFAWFTWPIFSGLK